MEDDWQSSKCISAEDEYVLWEERSGRMVGGKEDNVSEEEYHVRRARMRLGRG